MKTIAGIITIVTVLAGIFSVGAMEDKEQALTGAYAGAEPSYTEKVMRVTAYCPCEKCCGDWSDGFTASGKPAEGKLIAAPRNYAFGTRMDVPGYGVAYV